MAQLFVLSGPDVGKHFTLHEGDVLGRAPECSIQLRHASISRRHAHLEREGERWFVVDEGSRNGVVHESSRVTRLELVDQREFQLGELLLRFRADETDVALAPPPAARATPPPAKPRFDVDEIELEGEDELPRASAPTQFSAPPPPRAAPTPSFAPAGAEPRIERRSPPPPPPSTAPRPAAIDTGFGPAPSGAGASISRNKDRAGERILQFNKVEAKSGLGNAELSQLSTPVKLTIAVFALAVLGGLAWLAFSGTSWLKSKASAGSSEVEAPLDEAAESPDAESR
ncbi:MAG: FHA domain-containing protein [Planctomycetota bacterium]|nr:FHA domain-containing protein [Planctomycetota bacterium]